MLSFVVTERGEYVSLHAVRASREIAHEASEEIASLDGD
jgi:hypothetical protein